MSFEQMMAELREEYVASFPGKINEIQSHFAANDLERLCDDFHKLKGTGKTYGIPEISILGELIEKICMENKISPNRFIPEAIQILGNIYAHRSEKKPYLIEQCPVYMTLLKLPLVSNPK